MNADDVKKLLIPVPPLSEQNRIVAILDKFEKLVSSAGSATDGILAEIAARRQQYEYYRNKLLTFPSLRGRNANTSLRGRNARSNPQRTTMDCFACGSQ
jgi:type I restriction enzyme S subunit